MTNLLAQRKEIKRLAKAAERQREEEEDMKVREDEEARAKAVRDFEAVQMGLEGKVGGSGRVVGWRDGKVVVETEGGEDDNSGSRGKKRKFEIDEEELKRIASEDRSRARLALDEEKKAAKGHLPSFWVPGETPEQNHARLDTGKQSPMCPSSAVDAPHALSLKTLVGVNFTADKSPETGKSTPVCPSCRKTLSNASKAVLAVPCGHVLCKPCVDKFLRPEHRQQRDAHEEGPEGEGVHCYVCDADLTAERKERKDKDGKEGGKRKKDKEKGVGKGLVEIRSEGTGFAGGGKAVVRREGVAFQV